MQNLIVAVVLLCAIIFFGRRVYLSLRKGGGCGCGCGCDGCSSRKKNNGK